MRLIKQKGRDYGDKSYYKFLTVIPNKLLKILGWEGGEELKATIKDKKLIIEKK